MVCNVHRTVEQASLNHFQYPLSDRMVCNRNLHAFDYVCEDLSVSALGSNGLQLQYPLSHLPHYRTFSIRSRIEWSATSCRSVRTEQPTIFQYPLSDRMVCNPLCAIVQSVSI